MSDSRVWSQFQEAIFAFVSNNEGQDGKRNAIVKAVAGSGKTTTIVEAMRRIYGSNIFLAFNKSIATELQSRGVNAKTFHALTYGIVTKWRGCRSVTQDKLRQIVDANLNYEDGRMYGAFITRLVGLGRQSGIDCLIPDTIESWQALINHHDLELEDDRASESRAIELASKLLAASNESPMVDFDDLLYMPVREKLALPKFDFVFVDEAQDTNAIQRALLGKILAPTGRLVAVGDPAQAIYGFRGADSDSLDLIARDFGCIELPLTISYRCPQSVVEHARKWVSHIEAAPNAPAGMVENVGKWDVEKFEARDLVVCRTTKPLIALAYRMMKKRVPVYVMGREIGQGLISLIKKMNAFGIEQLIERLEAWKEREVEKAKAKRQDAKVEALEDKFDAVMCLIDTLPETNRTIQTLISIIEELFSERADATILATIHKAKGLEARNVYWLNSSQCPSKWARQEWQQQQERNLCYVATTRAMERLSLIEDKITAIDEEFEAVKAETLQVLKQDEQQALLDLE